MRLILNDTDAVTDVTTMISVYVTVKKIKTDDSEVEMCPETTQRVDLKDYLPWGSN